MMATKREKNIATALAAILYIAEAVFTAANVIMTLIAILAIYKGEPARWYIWLLLVIYLIIIALFVISKARKRADEALKWGEEQEQNNYPEWQKHCNVDECPLIKRFNNK
jgi:membrane protein implicated in regulation of membrane protease activity